MDRLVSVSLYIVLKRIWRLTDFYSWGTIEQILGVKNEFDLVPYVAVLGFLLCNSFLYLKEYKADSLIWKM